MLRVPRVLEVRTLKRRKLLAWRNRPIEVFPLRYAWCIESSMALYALCDFMVRNTAMSGKVRT